MTFPVRKSHARTSPQLDCTPASVYVTVPTREEARDWLHESRIRVLGRVYIAARAHGDASATQVWADYRDAVNERSNAQVARMEQRLGLR